MSRERDRALVRKGIDLATGSLMGCDDDSADRCIAAVDAQHPPAPLSRETALRVAEAVRSATLTDAADAFPASDVFDVHGRGGVRDIEAVCDWLHARAMAFPEPTAADYQRMADAGGTTPAETPYRAEQMSAAIDRASDLTAIVDSVLGAQSEVEAAERRALDALLRWGISGPPDGTSASQRAAALMDARDALRAAREKVGGR